MDGYHEAHLMRILEKRRQRGVLGVFDDMPGTKGGENRPRSHSITEGTQTPNRHVEASTSPPPFSRGIQTSLLALDTAGDTLTPSESRAPRSHPSSSAATRPNWRDDPRLNRPGATTAASPTSSMLAQRSPPRGGPTDWRSQPSAARSPTADGRNARYSPTSPERAEVRYKSPNLIPRIMYSPSRNQAGGGDGNGGVTTPQRTSPSRWRTPERPVPAAAPSFSSIPRPLSPPRYRHHDDDNRGRYVPNEWRARDRSPSRLVPTLDLRSRSPFASPARRPSWWDGSDGYTAQPLTRWRPSSSSSPSRFRYDADRAYPVAQDDGWRRRWQGGEGGSGFPTATVDPYADATLPPSHRHHRDVPANGHDRSRKSKSRDRSGSTKKDRHSSKHKDDHRDRRASRSKSRDRKKNDKSGHRTHKKDRKRDKERLDPRLALAPFDSLPIGVNDLDDPLNNWQQGAGAKDRASSSSSSSDSSSSSSEVSSYRGSAKKKKSKKHREKPSKETKKKGKNKSRKPSAMPFPDAANSSGKGGRPAGSVIPLVATSGSGYGNGFSPRHQGPFSASRTNVSHSQHVNPNDQVGIPDVRSTMDLKTSAQVLHAGDWFYKWNRNGTEVHPRWVWVDLQSYLLVWSHRETRDPTFSGSVKLETISQIMPSELVQADEEGLPKTYYVLMIETTTRVLQLATERRNKVDVWFEALNNIVAFVRRRDIAKGTQIPD